MLEVRPIVVDNNMVVLGGNMRLKASKEAGLDEVYIIKFDNLSEEKKKEFIIKDNVGYGEWDFDILKSEWNVDLLNTWGLDIVIEDYFDIDDRNNSDDEDDIEEKPTGSMNDYSTFDLVMLYDNKIKLLKILNDIKQQLDIEKQEDALMVLVDNYIVNKK
jgi:hypothetical protein